MTPTRKQPIFFVSGASGVGKSSACEILFRKETDYLVLESDLLWEERDNHPEDNYRDFRRLWLRVCANAAQIGKPVVLCGCTTPEQYETCPERELFAETHYLAVVCSDAELERRMREGRGITDPAWLESSRHFNRWLREHGPGLTPPVRLVEADGLTAEETAEQIEAWIRSALRESNGKESTT